MMVVQVTDGGGAKRAMRIESAEAVIGRQPCDVRLESWRVGRTHARLTRTRGGILIEDLGHMTGTWINGARIVQHGPLTAGDEIGIGGFKLASPSLRSIATAHRVRRHRSTRCEHGDAAEAGSGPAGASSRRDGRALPRTSASCGAASCTRSCSTPSTCGAATSPRCSTTRFAPRRKR